MKLILYILCQKVISQEHIELNKLSFGDSAIIQIDCLNESVQYVICQLHAHFTNIEVQYFTQSLNIAHADRAILFALENQGIHVSINREYIVGLSVYAAQRRHQYHMQNSDVALIIYDQMTSEIRNAIQYAKKIGVELHVICCTDS